MPRALASTILDSVAAFFAHTGRLTRFAARTLQASLSFRLEGRQILQQCVEVGLESVPVLVAVSIFIGMNVAIEGYATFLAFGGENMIGVFAGLTEVRELCPAIAAAILTAKAGTRMTSTIGLMRIKEQIDALEVMAVDPMRYIVAPRFIATVLMVPFLVLISDAVAIGASYLVSTIQLGLDPGAFWYYTVSYLHPSDIRNGMIKGLVFGAIISIMCCYFGYMAEKGPEGVGRATNRAVVFTGMVVISANLIMTDMMYN
jgi:phospholipid/cholesterol/gamma-HCH transport system permease protein